MNRSLLTLAAALTLSLPCTQAAEPRQKKPAPEAAPAGETKEPRSPNGRSLPYRAKVTAIDPQAVTFSSAGKAGSVNIFAATEKTVITKDSKPATFTDLTVGSIVTGIRTRTLGGKWEVASINILAADAAPKSRGKKDPAKPAEKKPDDAKPGTTTTETTPIPAPTDAPKAAEAPKPEEPKPDAKPEEKKPE